VTEQAQVVLPVQLGASKLAASAAPTSPQVSPPMQAPGTSKANIPVVTDVPE